MTDQLLDELRDLLAKQSIRRGDFTLSSGARSNYYCNTKKAVLSPRGSLLIGQVVYRLLAERHSEAVGGLALGATFIATAVALISELEGHPIYGYTVRDASKKHGDCRLVEESYHHDGGALISTGRRVAVVDDVVTGGGSILKAIDAVKERGCDICAVIAIVDREAGGGDRLLERGLPYLPLFYAGSEGELRVNGHARVREFSPARVAR